MKEGRFFCRCLALVGALSCPLLPQSGAAAESADLALFFESGELVEATSSAPRPISQVAENVTIVTAEQIRVMGVHTVTDVLTRVPGVFAITRGSDFAISEHISIHGSNYQHILVLVDGLRWNKVADGIFYTNSIPLSIIKRIEVIKGAASSTWGSALGGVINIITKDTGTSPRPTGTLSASYGEHASQEYSADAKGRFGRLGYFLAAGRQDSQGISRARYFANTPLYGKLDYELPAGRSLGLTMGYSQPDYIDLHDEIVFDLRSHTLDRNFFYTVNFDTPLTSELGLNLAVKSLKNELTVAGTTISTNLAANDNTYDQEIFGASGRLTWQQGRHAAVLGAELERAEETDRNNLTGYQAAPIYEESWAVYANDTMSWGKLTVIPGIRYDFSSISKAMVSPSLGATYRLSAATLLRGQVAKGFRKPALNTRKGDPVIYGAAVPADSLEPEKIWTYQAGLETGQAALGSLKTTLFWHEADAIWVNNTNGGHYTRKGLELEAQSIPWHDLALGASYTFVHQLPDQDTTGRQYNLKFSLDYDDRNSLTAQLFGHYVWWGAKASPLAWNGCYSALIWDLAAQKKLPLREDLGFELELFGAVRNLFNGSQYDDETAMNAPRWAEIGLRLHY